MRRCRHAHTQSPKGNEIALSDYRPKKASYYFAVREISSPFLFSILAVSQSSQNRKAGQPAAADPDGHGTKGELVREPDSSPVHS